MPSRPAEPEETGVLDLSFLATGARQHAFVRTGADDGWVYKVPACFGYLLPYEHRVANRGPVNTFRQAVHRVTVAWPHVVAARHVEPAIRRLERSAPTRPLAAVARTLLAGVRAVRNRVLQAYLRRARRRNFEDMLDVLEAVRAAGLEEAVLPFRILRDQEATLRTEERTARYRGPVLAQRRVSAFFTREHLHDFDWDEFIAAQQALWRSGFALMEKGENLGYRSWALLDGKPRLADTSSLTRDLRLARRALRPESLDAQERHVFSATADEEMAERFHRFFRHVRGSISQERLDELWLADAPAEPSAPDGG